MGIKIKNIIILLLLACLFLAFNSCVVPTNWVKNSAINLDNDLQHLSGVYYNAPLTIKENDSFSYPLYALLFKRDKMYTWNEFRDYSGKIKIDVISNKKIKVSYLVDDLIIEKKTITGKLIGNTFSLKRQIRFVPLLFFNYYGEVKTSIFLTEKHELAVDKGRYAFANILFMSGGGDSRTGGKYARISEE